MPERALSRRIDRADPRGRPGWTRVWVAVLVGTFAGLAGAQCAMVQVQRRYGRPARREVAPGDPPPGAVAVTLPRVNGRTLRGLFLPVERPGRRPAALVMHGWGASARDMLPIAQKLRSGGAHVLAIDARCHGGSDDDDFTSMPRFGEDIRAGLVWLRDHPRVDTSRLVLVGHSVGAGACLLVASTDPDVVAVVSIASMGHPRATMSAVLGRHLPRPLTAVALRVVERAIGHRFDTFAPVETIGCVRAPVLIVHGGRDTTVPVQDAHALRDRAGPRARLHIVEDADHAGIDALPEITAVLFRFLADVGVLDEHLRPSVPARLARPCPSDDAQAGG